MDIHLNRVGSVAFRGVQMAACLVGLAILPAVAGAQNLGSVDIGTTTTTAVRVTVQSAGTLGSIAVLTKGAPNLDFNDAGGDTCTPGTAYAVGATCTVHVRFKPRYPGPRYGAVELLTSSSALLATTYVQGIGVGPQTVFANSSKVGVYQPSAQLTLGLALCCEEPNDVAVDGGGNIFSSQLTNESGSTEVVEILATDEYKTAKVLNGPISDPTSLAVDGGGNLVVAGYPNWSPSESEPGPVTAGSLFEILAAGGYSTPRGLGTLLATGTAVDGNGNLFVVSGSEVSEILAAGGYTTVNPVASGFSTLSAIAVDGSGNLFVTDEGANAVYEIVAVEGSIPASPTIKTIATGFNGPDSLEVDASGNVFVADFYNNAVKEILAAGGYSQVLTLYRWSPSPYAIALDERGNVFIAAQYDFVHELDYADAPSLTFASTQVGALSSDSPQTVTVFNDGNKPLTFQLPSVGDNPSLPASFLLDSSSTCKQTISGSSPAFTLAEGESCTLAIDFKPETDGAITGSAVLTDNSLNVAGATQTIALEGTGREGPIVLSAYFLSFGSQGVGYPSASQYVTVTNTGTTALTITSVAVTGADESSFVFASNCVTSLAAGASCTIHGHMTPLLNGALTAAVTISDSAAGSPLNIALSGTGLGSAPPVTLSASSLSYPATAVGSSSGSQTVTMTNSGSAGLTITSIALTGANASSFVFANNCGSSLAVGASCRIHGHFAPSATGPMTAAVTVTSSAPGSPESFKLSGTGQ